MSEGSEIVCFQCGLSVGDPPRLNEMPDGEPCRSCAERLLDSLPPIFHAPIVTPTEAPTEEEGELVRVEEVEEPGDEPGEEQASSFEDDQPA